MPPPITDLNEILHSYVPVNMRVMGTEGFEKYLAKIHAAVHLFYSRERNLNESIQVIEITSQLLERAIDFHRTESCSTTLNAVELYDHIVNMLNQILKYDLQMDEQSYEEALKVSQSLKALIACDITPPGHQRNLHPSRWGGEEEYEAQRATALHYARENIEEFTRFAFNIASNHTYVVDPFNIGDSQKPLNLFKRLKSLGTGLSIIE